MLHPRSTPTPRAISPPATVQRYWLVFLLFLHTINTYMDRVCISAAKGPMQRDIVGLDDQTMGYVFGIFAIGYAFFQIPAGWFSDRAGPRFALTCVVLVWSVFTALTGAVGTVVSLLAVRFLFGAGEAGAYPGATRALYQWLPASERGLGQGIFHSGARLGAAGSLVVMPWAIDQFGWRMTFVLNALVGVVWGIVWWVWYRNDPSEHPQTNQAEVDIICSERVVSTSETETTPYLALVTSGNVLLAMFQYAASNITFFISMTWLHPYLVRTWGGQYGYLSAVPLLGGAAALWLSGLAVTLMYRRGMPVASRRVPAMIGYTLGAIGLLACTQVAASDSVWWFIVCFSVATFGVEMTLSPSWAFCMDVGGTRSGSVSAAMNMVGNLGAALSAVAFPYFVANVTIPGLVESTGTANSFFLFAALMNGLAAMVWLFMNPLRVIRPLSPGQMRGRMAMVAVGFVLIIAVILYVNLALPRGVKKQSSQTKGSGRIVASIPLEGRFCLGEFTRHGRLGHRVATATLPVAGSSTIRSTLGKRHGTVDLVALDGQGSVR